MTEVFVCSNCGNQYPARQMKEVFWEEGRKRFKQELCPSCLDQRMNRSTRVRGIVGQKKAAAIHVDETNPEHGLEQRVRQSIGERGRSS
jgi:hypothetical protein